ncbi:Eco57I restriction-modification methylase domain-containing protein [Streptomyces sp. NPDC102364]|uniref:Eco57I restriction-modification methylase domain-containing protein n=1 Tax=Streptomyces sp. NPDC102364 TaxID=3366161 RepID=UPI00382F8388
MTVEARPNPVDDRKFTAPLARALARHSGAVAGTLSGKTAWRTASRWVYATVLIAWAEDHGLIPARLRAEAELARKEHVREGGTLADWVRDGIKDLAVHPATGCLSDDRYLPMDHAPAEPALQALTDWWSADAPDFAYPVDKGPASITGWLCGDLLQEQQDEQRKAAALCQTPWWVADFLCERTLVPALAAFPNERLIRVIDPACGSGHILTWIMIGLYQWYRHGVPQLEPTAALRRVLAGLHGVELDPLTAAVARLRLTVVAGSLLAADGALPTPMRLHHIPAWVRPRIAVGNALLAGLDDPHPPGTILDDTALYPGILQRGTYHAVIANPPYKVVKDKTVKEAIRAAYPTAVGNYPLSVPFTELLFDLAIRGGTVSGPEQLDLFGDAPASASTPNPTRRSST